MDMDMDMGLQGVPTFHVGSEGHRKVVEVLCRAGGVAAVHVPGLRGGLGSGSGSELGLGSG
eukprot:scaffold254_cov71-Phaeocystis_antarctica.AAC.5